MDRDISEIIKGLHLLEIKVLQAFGEIRSLLEDEIVEKTGLTGSQVSMAIGWLLTKGILQLVEERPDERVFLTDVGIRYADVRLPEIRILRWAKDNPNPTIAGLKDRQLLESEELSSAIGALKRSGVIRIGKGGRIEVDEDETKSSRFQQIQYIIENFKDFGVIDKDHSKARGEIGDKEWSWIEEYSSRKRGGGDGSFRIYEVRSRIYAITRDKEDILEEAFRLKGVEFEEVSHLDPSMLQDGSWRRKRFRRYNINLKPRRQAMGKKHPYREFLDFVKYRLVAMGFEEMRGGLVESEFWNMDALFMPQFHPAREIHDVYFIKDPMYAARIEEPFLSNVSATHRDGWRTGSKGWLYDFDKERARRLILRSQGTSVSARKLADRPRIPGKYFSIARCFRYEQVDATHATDFFQIEGIILGEKINFRILLGLLQLFAKEVAMAEESRFIPAYFPFTEPSVELHVRHPQLGWMELGGAGLFRPEVTLPLGIDVPVIAWGLGLDRMAMVALDIHDIRDLFSGDLDLIRTKRIRGWNKRGLALHSQG